jgi:hypothetical protein
LTIQTVARWLSISPRGYAIWLLEDEPSEYGVLLVKLNTAGNNMEDAWHLGKFPTREEQGSFGLKVARSANKTHGYRQKWTIRDAEEVRFYRLVLKPIGKHDPLFVTEFVVYRVAMEGWRGQGSYC